MADRALKVGPQDLDRPGDIVQRYGVHNQATRLLKRMAKAQPAELMAHIALPRDDERSRALDPDEVRKVARVPGTVEGASVKGSEDVTNDRRRVIVTYIVESGRSAKASLPYEDFPKSIRRFEDRERIKLGIAAAAAPLADTTGAPSSPDPASGEVAQELRDRVVELEGQLAAAESGSVEVEVTAPEPFEGSSQASVPDIVARIGDEPEGFDRELLKRNLRDAEEQRESPRKGVLDATEPVALVPAGESGG